MKKLLCMMLALLLLTACAPTVDLMPNANPDSSALFAAYFDGESGVYQTMFDDEAEREIIDAFQNARAELLPEFDPTSMQAPFYAIEMGAGDYGMASGLWSDGVFVTSSGEAYAFDYDFEALLSHASFHEEHKRQLSSLISMPCAAYVVKDENGWKSDYLPQAQPLSPVDGISASLVSADRESVTLQFTNESGEEWSYGAYYHLEVLLDGQWYQIPVSPEGEWSFIDIAYVLADADTSQKTYRLQMYGELPAGTYRIVAENMTAEFTLS